MRLDINKIELYMAKKSMTFAQLNRTAGIGNNTISRIRKGENNNTPSTAEAIAKALGVDVGKLVIKEKR